MNCLRLNKPITGCWRRVSRRRLERKPRATSFTDFLTKVDHGDITDVAIFPGSPEIRFLDSSGIVDTAKVILNDSVINELREHAVNIQIANPPVNFIQDIFPYILVGSFLLFLMRNAPKPPAIPGTKKEFEVVKDIETRFDDVAGIDQELNEVKEIVDFLKTPEKFIEAGAKVPTGCLLSGPPGTGKTLMARAIAGEAEVPFIATSASQFIELFVGLGAARVRGLFKLARENAPCIVFIDELDAIAKSRSPSPIGNNNDEREQTLNQILTEMDGFKENSGIIVLGATNRPDVIDPAILRPGRFDRKIEVGLPDSDGRKKILEVHSNNKKLAEGVTLDDLSKLTIGFSGAELQNLMNEAAIYAARDGRVNITRVDIDNSYEKVTIGLPKTRKVDEDTKRLVAYHEAGHAIMGVICGQKVGKVTILPRGGAGGFTQFIPKEDGSMTTQGDLRNQIKIALGGRAAEELIYGEANITTGAAADLQQVTRIAYQMFESFGFSSSIGNFAVDDDPSDFLKSMVDQEVQYCVHRIYDEVLDDLSSFKLALSTLAETLVAIDTVHGETVEQLVYNPEEFIP
jgi:cell division protease FtsH